MTESAIRAQIEICEKMRAEDEDDSAYRVEPPMGQVFQDAVHDPLTGYEAVLRENLRLREALGHYADKKMWSKAVIDSYSGECDFFDWPGALADEPWEIAEKALGEGDSRRGAGLPAEGQETQGSAATETPEGDQVACVF